MFRELSSLLFLQYPKIFFFKAEFYTKKFLRAFDLFCMIMHTLKIKFLKHFQNYSLPGIMQIRN